MTGTIWKISRVQNINIHVKLKKRGPSFGVQLRDCVGCVGTSDDSQSGTELSSGFLPSGEKTSVSENMCCRSQSTMAEKVGQPQN